MTGAKSIIEELTPSMKGKERKNFNILMRVDREEPELGKNGILSWTKTEHLDLCRHYLTFNQCTILANSSCCGGGWSSRGEFHYLSWVIAQYCPYWSRHLLCVAWQKKIQEENFLLKGN